MGVISRIANLWRGFLSIWISDIEKEHPEIASEIDLQPVDGSQRKTPADVFVTHAGTARIHSGQLVTAGGRVLNVTAASIEVGPRPRRGEPGGVVGVQFQA